MANFITGILSLTIGVVVLANVFMSTVKATVPDATTRCLAEAWNGTHCTGEVTLTVAEYALWGLLWCAKRLWTCVKIS